MTAESVAALQNSGDRDLDLFTLQPYYFDDLLAEMGPLETAPLLLPSSEKDNSTLSVDPWFLGGLDPFSALPEIDGCPIPKATLLYYCTYHHVSH